MNWNIGQQISRLKEIKNNLKLSETNETLKNGESLRQTKQILLKEWDQSNIYKNIIQEFPKQKIQANDDKSSMN